MKMLKASLYLRSGMSFLANQSGKKINFKNMKALMWMIGLVLIASLSSFKGEKKTTASEPAPVMNNSITGIVLDSTTGEALAGVEVRVEGTERKVYTDFDGKFVFEGIQPGSYKLSTSYISYKEKETPALSVKTNELHALNLELEPANK